MVIVAVPAARHRDGKAYMREMIGDVLSRYSDDSCAFRRWASFSDTATQVIGAMRDEARKPRKKTGTRLRAVTAHFPILASLRQSNPLQPFATFFRAPTFYWGEAQMARWAGRNDPADHFACRTPPA